MNAARIVAIVLGAGGVLSAVTAAISFHLDETAWGYFSDRMHQIGNILLLAALIVFLIDVMSKRTHDPR